MNNQYEHAVCLYTFVVDDFSGFYRHAFIFSSKGSATAFITNGNFIDFSRRLYFHTFLPFPGISI